MTDAVHEHTSTGPLPWRGRLALVAGSAAARLSRAAGFGGQMIVGRVALMVHPPCLAELAAGRAIALVSGTNGKTTTTAMLAAALRQIGPVATNDSGANMLDGITTALAARVVVLLNLTRDQLDRIGEVQNTAQRWREVGTACPQTTVVANCDDPMVVWAAAAFRRVIWVACGSGWDHDRQSCPFCGQRLRTDPASGGWACRGCDRHRPAPHWHLESAVDAPTLLLGPDLGSWPLPTALPGQVNRANAAIAVAAACEMGVAPVRAVTAVSSVSHVAGRYATLQVGAHRVRLILAKNPASWSVVLDLLCQDHDQGPVLVAVNAEQADGRDTSWLYDVDFERLAGRHVTATGARAAELGVRLAYAGINHTTLAGDPVAALQAIPPGDLTLVGDYSSFHRAYRAWGPRRRDPAFRRFRPAPGRRGRMMTAESPSQANRAR